MNDTSLKGPVKTITHYTYMNDGQMNYDTTKFIVEYDENQNFTKSNKIIDGKKKLWRERKYDENDSLFLDIFYGRGSDTSALTKFTYGPHGRINEYTFYKSGKQSGFVYKYDDKGNLTEKLKITAHGSHEHEELFEKYEYNDQGDLIRKELVGKEIRTYNGDTMIVHNLIYNSKEIAFFDADGYLDSVISSSIKVSQEDSDTTESTYTLDKVAYYQQDENGNLISIYISHPEHKEKTQITETVYVYDDHENIISEKLYSIQADKKYLYRHYAREIIYYE